MFKLIVVACSMLFSTHILASSLEGVWKLIFAEHKYAGSSQWNKLDINESFKSYKILKDGYYAVVTQDADKDIFGAKMGRYSVEGDVYTEQFTAHNKPQFIGKEGSFTFKLEREKWYVYSENMVEVWQRVEPESH